MLIVKSFNFCFFHIYILKPASSYLDLKKNKKKHIFTLHLLFQISVFLYSLAVCFITQKYSFTPN